MIRNYFKIAWRTLLRNKALFSINIIGLSIGIATCLTIALFVVDELSFDRFHKNGDRIVRVTLDAKMGDEIIREAGIMAPVGEVLKNELPEVLDATRFVKVSDRTKAIYGDKTIRKGNLAYADPNFFKIFSFSLVKGDPETALSQPNSLVLTEEQARAYFGDEDPMNKTLKLEGIGIYSSEGYQDTSGLYTVTGILEEMPRNSHFHFQMLASMGSNSDATNQSWLSGSYHTYLLLSPGTELHLLDGKLAAITEKYMSSQLEKGLGMTYGEFVANGNRIGLNLQPLTRIHLYSDLREELEAGGSITTVYMFGAIALFMLLIACINFMNLSTAGASKRLKEIGMRKVLGSGKGQLRFQFLAEAFLAAVFAMGLGVLVFVISLPFFNRLSGKAFEFSQVITPGFCFAALGLTIVISFLAGGYPAFFMSGFRPVQALKNRFTSNGSKGVRSGLVVFQFAISSCLIVAAIVVSRQMSYIQNKDVGYDRDELIVIRDAGLLGEHLDAFKTELESDPRIVRITTSAYVPAGPTDSHGVALSSDKDTSNKLRVGVYDVDEDYIPTLGMKLLEGRNFSKEFGSEENNIIINETAVKALALGENPVGQTLVVMTDQEGGRQNLNVIGVVKDFHSRSLHDPILPMMMVYNPYYGLIAKVKSADIPGVLANMEDHWKEYGTGEAFSYNFLDALYNETYTKERNMNSILRIFALLTIFVACLGLFGLVTFTTQQRFKEISIRKVLGSSVSGIVKLLTKDFLKLILASFLIAFPLGYYTMNIWLEDFAYHISIEWWVYALAGLATLVIGFLTMSIKSIAAAFANPVKSLKAE